VVLCVARTFLIALRLTRQTGLLFRYFAVQNYTFFLTLATFAADSYEKTAFS